MDMQLKEKMTWTSAWFSEACADLRQRRIIEYSILTIDLTFFGFISVGVSKLDILVLGIPGKVFLGIFIIFMILLSIYKIHDEHKKYCEVCQAQIRFLEKMEFPVDILPRHYKKFGTGKGYLITILMVIFSGATCVSFILFL